MDSLNIIIKIKSIFYNILIIIFILKYSYKKKMEIKKNNKNIQT